MTLEIQVISIASSLICVAILLIPLFYSLSYKIKNQVGYAGFILVSLFWIYNILGFIRHAAYTVDMSDEKFVRYANEYGAIALYTPTSLIVTCSYYLVFALSFFLGCRLCLFKKRIVKVDEEAVAAPPKRFGISLTLATALFAGALLVIKDSLAELIFSNVDENIYSAISAGVDNYSVHSMLIRLSSIALIYTFLIAKSKVQKLACYAAFIILFISMFALGQRNEIALLLLSALFIHLHTSKLSKRLIFTGVIFLTLLRFIEVSRAEALGTWASDPALIISNLFQSILTFWHPVLLGAETVFTHFSNLSIPTTEILLNPLDRISFWLLAVIPNSFEVSRGLTSYDLLKESISLSDDRGYNISIFASSAYSFGFMGGLIFIALFSFLTSSVIKKLYRSQNAKNRWIHLTTISIVVAYVFILNRSGIDNMKPLIFYSIFAYLYGAFIYSNRSIKIRIFQHSKPVKSIGFN